MTGYGRGQSEGKGCRVTVEIRSVNHRFLDLKLRGAALDPGTEEKLRQAIGSLVNRGALSVSTRVERRSGQGETRIDHAAARRAYSELRELGAVLGLTREVSISLVCSQPGVVVAAEADEESGKEVAAKIIEAAQVALEELGNMRETEGTSLKADMLARLERLGALAATLETLSATTPQEAQKRLEDRIERLLKNSKIQVDEARLAQEVAIAADKLDVTEELVRVASHLAQVRELLESKDPVGRRLDFLVQELGREFNTVTSKSQSADVARVVVDAKAELEKIREQVQNIE